MQAMYGRTRAGGFGDEVKRRIMLGTYVLSAGYYDVLPEGPAGPDAHSSRLRSRLQSCGCGSHAHESDRSVQDRRAGRRSAADVLADVFTVSAPLAGLPAISVPCGFTSCDATRRDPVHGRRFDEATLFKIADAYERDAPW